MIFDEFIELISVVYSSELLYGSFLVRLFNVLLFFFFFVYFAVVDMMVTLLLLIPPVLCIVML